MPTIHVQSTASGAGSAPARSRRRRRILAIALAASSAIGLVSTDHAAAATPHVRSEATTDTPTTRVCDGLWDRILVLGLPEQAWPSVAAWLGFAQSGEWLSADGLTWEHFDGRVVVVATPQSSDGDAGSAGCRAGVAMAGTTQHARSGS